MKRILFDLLGEVLHVANSRPPFVYKDEFYNLKDTLLCRFGKPDGFDIQHIVKECWECDGGYRSESVNNLGMVVSVKRKCMKCGGSGIYLQFWTRLSRYQIGRRVFHHPERRYYVDPEIPLQRPVIVGYVEHQKYSGYLHTEALLWLSLVYDLKLFCRIFGLWGSPGLKYTPMVFLSDFLFRTRMIKLVDWFRVWQSKWQWFRQTHCRHEFPIGNFIWDNCLKCGISRWLTMSPEVQNEEVPF